MINQTFTDVTIYWTKIGYCDTCNGWVANESPKITGIYPSFILMSVTIMPECLWFILDQIVGQIYETFDNT